MTTIEERRELVESVSYAVDIVREALRVAEARHGRGSDLYVALRAFESAGLRARAVAAVPVAWCLRAVA